MEYISLQVIWCVKLLHALRTNEFMPQWFSLKWIKSSSIYACRAWLYLWIIPICARSPKGMKLQNTACGKIKRHTFSVSSCRFINHRPSTYCVSRNLSGFTLFSVSCVPLSCRGDQTMLKEPLCTIYKEEMRGNGEGEKTRSLSIKSRIKVLLDNNNKWSLCKEMPLSYISYLGGEWVNKKPPFSKFLFPKKQK